MKGDLSLQEGCGAVAVVEVALILTGPVGPGMRLIKENTDDVVKVTGCGVEVGVTKVTVEEGRVEDRLRTLPIYETSYDGCNVGMPG